MTEPKPPYWRVQIVGPAIDTLDALLNLPNLGTVKDGDDVFLVSPEFETLDDTHAIDERANQLLPIINGAGALSSHGFKPVTLGPIYRIGEDGRKDAFIVAKGALISLSARVAGVGVVMGKDGNVKHSKPTEPTLIKAVRHGRESDDVAYVLSLLNEPTWHNLYKIHERMRKVLGDKYLSTIERTKSELGRFTQTANYEQRHDSKATGFQPHENPMTDREAIDFVRANIVRWLGTLQ